MVKFTNGFCIKVADIDVLDNFSRLLSQAISVFSTIRQIQTKDILDKWGTSTTHHDSTYGRYLLYKDKGKALIPFWIELYFIGNNAHIAITFDKELLNDLSLTQKILTHSGTYAVQGQPNKSDIELMLEPSKFMALQNAGVLPGDVQVLADFMDEVLKLL